MTPIEEPQMNWFRRLIRNDNAIKALFDHFRNITICGAIAAAGFVSLQYQSSVPFIHWMGQLSGTSLLIVAGFLFVLNERNGSHKFDAADIPLVASFMAKLIYGMSLIPLFSIVVAKTLGVKL